MAKKMDKATFDLQMLLLGHSITEKEFQVNDNYWDYFTGTYHMYVWVNPGSNTLSARLGYPGVTSRNRTIKEPNYDTLLAKILNKNSNLYAGIVFVDPASGIDIFAMAPTKIQGTVTGRIPSIVIHGDVEDTLSWQL